MKKINNYIRYLLTLILLRSINVYAQTTGGLSQVFSRAHQQLSNLFPSSNSSFLNSTFFSEIREIMKKTILNTYKASTL